MPLFSHPALPVRSPAPGLNRQYRGRRPLYIRCPEEAYGGCAAKRRSPLMSTYTLKKRLQKRTEMRCQSRNLFCAQRDGGIFRRMQKSAGIVTAGESDFRFCQVSALQRLGMTSSLCGSASTDKTMQKTINFFAHRRKSISNRINRIAKTRGQAQFRTSFRINKSGARAEAKNALFIECITESTKSCIMKGLDRFSRQIAFCENVQLRALRILPQTQGAKCSDAIASRC